MAKVGDFIPVDTLNRIQTTETKKVNRRRKVDEEEKIEFDCKEIEESMIRISELPINRNR